MTGGEFAAAALAGQVVKHAGKAIAEEERSTKQELLEQAKETPEFAEGARQLAKRIAIRQEIITNCYKPIAKLFGVANHYFDNDFEKELAEKLADVPEEHIVAPKASLAAPAMLQLGFSLDEPGLKDMYLNLLATASDDRKSESAHPSFVEVIKQLSANEATLLNGVLEDGRTLSPIVNLRLVTKGLQGGSYLQRHVMQLVDMHTESPKELPMLATFIDNWRRLGIVDIDYSVHMVAANAYDWVVDRPEYLRHKKALAPDGSETIEIGKGILRPTDFGLSFAKAVGTLVDQPGDVNNS